MKLNNSVPALRVPMMTSGDIRHHQKFSTPSLRVGFDRSAQKYIFETETPNGRFNLLSAGREIDFVRQSTYSGGSVGLEILENLVEH